jgi:hypothetical protein
LINLNIFRNPFIDSQVGYLIDSYENGLRKQTESYWRNTIANELLEFGAKIESNIPNTSAEIHHGEEMLRQWAKYIIQQCVNISEGNNEEAYRNL